MSEKSQVSGSEAQEILNSRDRTAVAAECEFAGDIMTRAAVPPGAPYTRLASFDTQGRQLCQLSLGPRNPGTSFYYPCGVYGLPDRLCRSLLANPGKPRPHVGR